VTPTPADLPIQPEHREMVWILKLARRFARPADEPVRPKVIENGQDRTDEFLGASYGPAAIHVDELYSELTAPDRERWATLDPEGRLIVSTNRQRLAELLANADRRYRTYMQDGHLVLESTLPSGETYLAWLEEDTDHPDRPVAHVAAKAPAETPRRNASAPAWRWRGFGPRPDPAASRSSGQVIVLETGG